MQTYRMGNKQEMVVAVRAPEGKQGPIEVALTTDVAQDLFLHWGVRRQGGGDWVAPPKVRKLCKTMVEGPYFALDGALDVMILTQALDESNCQD